MSAYDDNDFGAMNHLEDLLDAYCETRLAPRSAVLARIRANVLAEAASASAIALASNRLRLVDAAPATRGVGSPSRFVRAAFALGFAAMLMLGTSMAVLASPPGSAFYNARVYIETLTLPAQAEARFEAHEKLLQERLAEAQAAAASDNGIGLAAALGAYQAEVDAATADAGTDPDRLAHLEEMLAKHSDVLSALAATLPDQASIDKAIDASSKAITKIQQKSNAAHPTHGPQGGPGGGAGAGQGDGNSDEDGQGGQGGSGGQSPSR